MQCAEDLLSLSSGPEDVESPNVMDEHYRRADARGIHTHFDDNTEDQDTPNGSILTREQMKEECHRLGLILPGKNNINQQDTQGQKGAPWTGPWLRLDTLDEKLWLSTFDMGEGGSRHTTETFDEYSNRIRSLTPGWIVKEGIKGSGNVCPSRSIDITYCHPSEFNRIVRQFM
jgi:hypothetical protein